MQILGIKVEDLSGTTNWSKRLVKSLLEHFGAHLGSDRQSAPAGSILEVTPPHRVCGVSSFFACFAHLNSPCTSQPSAY